MSVSWLVFLIAAVTKQPDTSTRRGRKRRKSNAMAGGERNYKGLTIDCLSYSVFYINSFPGWSR